MFRFKSQRKYYEFIMIENNAIIPKYNSSSIKRHGEDWVGDGAPQRFHGSFLLYNTGK